jgi:hypothetical protein
MGRKTEDWEIEQPIEKRQPERQECLFFHRNITKLDRFLH